MTMSLVGDLLRKVGILSQFTADDILDASIEDKFHDQQKAVAEIQNATAERRQSRVKLRRAIEEATIRSTPFADLEHAMRRPRRDR